MTGRSAGLTTSRRDCRAIVFDLDGTLADTFGDIAAAANHALLRQGRPALPVETVMAFVGNGMRKLLIGVFGMNPSAPDAAGLEQALADARAYYREHLTDTARLYPGVAATLAALKRRGYKLAALSNKPDELARPIIERLGLHRHLDAYYGKREEFPLKPDPAGLLALLDELGVKREQAVMIGDSATDRQLALNAGITFYGVSYGASTSGQSQLFNAEQFIDHFSKLVDLFPELD